MAAVTTFPFNFRKALAALTFVASQPSKIVWPFDKYRAVKLLFLAERDHLIRYGRPIFGDYYKALPWGPVPQTILDILHQVEDDNIRDEEARQTAEAIGISAVEGHGYPCFVAKREPDFAVLSRSDLRILEDVCHRYGRLSFEELSAITHQIAAYQRAWAGRGDAQAARMRIEDLFEDPNATPGALEEMLEDVAVRRTYSER